MKLFKKILNYKLLLVLATLLFITGCGNSDNPDNKALNDVRHLLQSNDSDVNRELGVYILGASGTVQRVKSADCSIEEKDDFGRYILLCSINYSTSAATNAGTAEHGVYVGYLNTGEGHYSYKIGATNYSNSSGIESMKNKICWNSSAKDMNCTVNDSYNQNSNITEETTDSEATNYTSNDYFNKITMGEYKKMYSARNEYLVILIGFPTCSHTAAVLPTLEQISSEYSFSIYYLDTDEMSEDDLDAFTKINKKHANGFSTPTIEIIGHDSIKDRLEGEATRDEYISFFNKNKIIN